MLVLAATCFAASILTTACGVGAQSEPQRIERADVPFGLAERPADPGAPPDAPHSFTIYLVRDDRVRPVLRGARREPTPRAQLERLLQGPTPAEADAGLRTLLTPDVTIGPVRVLDGVAVVTLSGTATAQPSAHERVLAVAQLVYTATAIPEVQRVRFEVDGDAAEVPRGDGTLTNRPVGRKDYALVAA
jgi:spore germination protein GerM